jgi:hypothetical protein
MCRVWKEVPLEAGVRGQGFEVQVRLFHKNKSARATTERTSKGGCSTSQNYEGARQSFGLGSSEVGRAGGTRCFPSV